MAEGPIKKILNRRPMRSGGNTDDIVFFMLDIHGGANSIQRTITRDDLGKDREMYKKTLRKMEEDVERLREEEIDRDTLYTLKDLIKSAYRNIENGDWRELHNTMAKMDGTLTATFQRAVKSGTFGD